MEPARSPRLRAARAALVVALLFLAGIQAYLSAVVVLKLPYHSDFHGYYFAGLIGREHGWSHIYDFDLQRQLVLSHPAPWLVLFPYLNPPPVAWLAALLTPLPYPAALLVWVAGLLLALLVTWAALAPDGRRLKAFHLLVALAFYPVCYAIQLGQVTLVVGAAVAGCWWLLKRDREWLAGLVLSAGVVKPHIILLLPIALLLVGRRRAFLAWALSSAVLLAISVATLGPSGIQAYQASLAVGLFNDLGGFWSFLAPPEAALAAGVVGVLALMAIWRHRASEEVAMAAALLGSLLIQSHLGILDFTLVLVAGWLLLRSPDRRPSHDLQLAALVAAELSYYSTVPLVLVCSAWLAWMAIPWPPGLRLRRTAPFERADAA